MNPFVFMADRVRRARFRHKVLGPLEVRDRSDMERFLDGCRWLHRAGDGVLVERRWDSQRETVVGPAAIRTLAQTLGREKATALILDATTSGDRSLREGFAGTDLRVLVCREHPTEIPELAWIGKPWADGEPRPRWFR